MIASPLESSLPGSSGAVRTASVGSLVLIDVAEGSAEHSTQAMPPSVSQTGEASQEVQVRQSAVVNISRGCISVRLITSAGHQHTPQHVTRRQCPKLLQAWQIWRD